MIYIIPHPPVFYSGFKITESFSVNSDLEIHL